MCHLPFQVPQLHPSESQSVIPSCSVRLRSSHSTCPAAVVAAARCFVWEAQDRFLTLLTDCDCCQLAWISFPSTCTCEAAFAFKGGSLQPFAQWLSHMPLPLGLIGRSYFSGQHGSCWENPDYVLACCRRVARGSTVTSLAGLDLLKQLCVCWVWLQKPWTFLTP